MSITQSLLLSVLQGITEFLPISSTGHLLLVPYFFDWKDQGLAFDAMIHLGTALAATIYFRKDIVKVLKGFFVDKNKEGRRLGWMIIISMIPALIVGLSLKELIATEFRAVVLVAFNLLIWGFVLIGADKYANRHPQKQKLENIGYIKAFVIGMAQAVALLPGTSRSGITIIAGLFSDISKKDAVRFSFLMGIPVIFGAGILSLIELFQDSAAYDISIPIILLSLLGAFFSGLIAIHFLLSIVNRKGLLVFGVYRILLAVFLFVTFILS